MVTRTGLLGWARLSLGLALAAALGLGAATGQARASANLTFTLTPQSTTGLISYAGGGSPLVGSDLSVASVTGLATPTNPNASLGLDAGTLDFSTGNVSTHTPGAETDFLGGGKIEIHGGVAALGIAPGSILMTGQFYGDTFVKYVGNGDLKVQGGAFFNVVNPTLASYFGLPVGAASYSGAMATLFEAPANASGAFASVDLSSGSVTTSPTGGPSVPEPSTFAMFAIVAGGGLVYTRRRRAR